MRSISRTCDVAMETVGRYLDLAGEACAVHHDEHVRGIKGKRDVQCDEIWSFIYAKDKALEVGDPDPWDAAGTYWTFTGLDADSKLMISYLLRRGRGIRSATAFFRDMDGRLIKRPKITADSLRAYRSAARNVWGRKAELSQLRKGHETDHNTAYVERLNLTIRMALRRYTRKTNGFSKSIERHQAALDLFFTYYNFCRIHTTLEVTPAIEAGICKEVRDFDWILDMIEARRPPRKKPGPKPGTKYQSQRNKAQ